MKFFCDTYALVEIIKGNKAYTPFLNQELYTCVFNLYELFYNLLREYNEEVAKRYFYEFASLAIEVDDEHIFAAGRYKLEMTKKNISYTDALGYAIAEKEGLKFLTGDKEFQHLSNVQFVK